jgi:hypothetical protein
MPSFDNCHDISRYERQTALFSRHAADLLEFLIECEMVIKKQCNRLRVAKTDAALQQIGPRVCRENEMPMAKNGGRGTSRRLASE